MKMKKRNLALMAAVFNASLAIAGGLLTNTNQSVHFLRNPARDASTSIDAVYTNPAALIKLENGLHFSINNQSAFQTRTITSTFAPFAGYGGSATKEFEGKASVPVIPSVMGVYRVGDWALSGSISVVGGGGKATFNRGLPSFEAGLSQLPGVINLVGQGVKAQLDAAYPGVFPNAGLTANQYSVDAYMEGSSIIYGAQLGGTYKINDMFSAYAGFRLNIVSNGYTGHLRDLQINPTSVDLPPALGLNYTGTMVNAPELIDMAIAGTVDEGEKAQLGLLKKASTATGVELDCTQSGWGVAPILGFNFNYQDKLNVGVKYEFKTALEVENKTEKDDTGLFKDGVNTPHDIPALLTVGVSYKILPQLTASAGYHHFFDSDAKMSNDKQKYAGSTNEYLLGAEYQINRLFLVSAGAQITQYGVEDAYQQDLSFACDSYSIGLGGAVNVSPTVKINLGYFWTTYSDYTKELGGGTTKDIFSRTNKVFGAGVDFRF
jgi:long-chain fatty acid transport protein